MIDFIENNTIQLMDNDTFEKVLPELAEQLSQMDFHYHHDEATLKKAWKKLCSYRNEKHHTASQVRAGIELCEEFFPNFFDIKNKKGKGFTDFWNPTDLQKVIRWNRSSASKAWFSELRRGVYFTAGLTKNTMYRPHLAKMICDFYKPQAVLDPCCGWGGRMIGVVASGAKYIGYEPNTETFQHLCELRDFLGIQDKVEIFNFPAEKIDDNDFTRANLLLTSPPYYDVEIYCDEDTQSYVKYNSYKDWVEGWLRPLIEKGLRANLISCWNVSKDMEKDIEKIHLDNNYYVDDVFFLGNPVRQANQNAAKNKRTTDSTVCYKPNS